MTGSIRNGAKPPSDRLGAQQALRQRNRKIVLDTLSRNGPLTQSELARRTQLSPGTISSLVKELCADSIVHTTAVVSHGRRATQVSLTADSRLVLGVDIGRSHLRLAIFDLEQKVIARTDQVLEHGHRADETIRIARGIVDKLLAENHLTLADLELAVVGLPASIAPDGTVVQASVLPAWSDVDLHEMCRETFGIPVYLENDANLGALAVRATQATEHDNLIYIKLATGVGAGLILNGTLYRSASGLVGEIGHIQISDSGTVCTCGNRGCLETVASVRRLVDDFNVIRQGGRQGLNDLVAAALADDPTVLRLLGDAGQALGKMMATLGNLFAPDAVIVGGSLGPATEKVLVSARAAIAQYALPAVAQRTTFTTSRLAESTEILGAGVLGAALVRADSIHA